MSGLSIGDVRIETVGQSHRASAQIVHPRGATDVWFESPLPFGPQPMDAFVLLAAACAVRCGGGIRADQPVSHRLAEGIWRTSTWRQAEAAGAQEVVVRAPLHVGAENPPPGPSRAALFTAGVDSFHTAMDERLKIDTLISVIGADVSLSNRVLADSVRARWRDAAAELGKRSVVVSTNFRELLDQYAPWPRVFAPALSAVAHLFHGEIGVLYHSASLAWSEMARPVSESLRVPLQSSESLWCGVHGAEATRHQKLAAVCRSDVVRRTLQVCIANPSGTGNCSACEKCLVTMLGLHAEGVLPEFTTFDRRLDPQTVRAMRLRVDTSPFHAREVLSKLAASPGNRDLARALDYALRRAEGRTLSRRWRRLFRPAGMG